MDGTCSRGKPASSFHEEPLNVSHARIINEAVRGLIQEEETKQDKLRIFSNHLMLMSLFKPVVSFTY